MKTTAKEQIRNIIFDLGGVILNIDFKKTEQAFVNLGIHNFAELYDQFHATELFLNFENGTVTPEEFISELQTKAHGIPKEKIIDAWNAMLLNFPERRIRLLLDLKKRYRTFLLSNTNAIHHDAFQKIYPGIIDSAGSLDACFEKVYYSHLLKMRKPDKAIYQFVLDQNGLVAGETLFIDDTQDNVLAAESVGIKGLYLKRPLTIEDALVDY